MANRKWRKAKGKGASDSLPAMVLPYHDPDAILYPHLLSIRETLGTLYSRAFISVSPRTELNQPAMLNTLQSDPFFVVNLNAADSIVGHHYLAGMRSALSHSDPDQVLHICDIDRVAFALRTEHRNQFLADLEAVRGVTEPLLFQRSVWAWQTYPMNYREIESWAIRAGEMLLGKRIDFAWSYFVTPAHTLAESLPHVRYRDFRILVELVLHVLDSLQTRDVDWLAWEDPYILGINASELRASREMDPEETRKRLRGLTPLMQPLIETIGTLNTGGGWERPRS
jgi:hypothetical protein